MLALLVGYLGDFELAEESAAEAFAVAARRWPAEGVPDHPAAWLVTTARNRAIDRLRRDREGLRDRLLGELEVAEVADEHCEHTAPLVTEDLLEGRQVAALPMTGRTSTVPPIRSTGIRAAISVAWSRLSHSYT